MTARHQGALCPAVLSLIQTVGVTETPCLTYPAGPVKSGAPEHVVGFTERQNAVPSITAVIV